MCPDQIRDNFGILLDVYKTFAMMVKMLNIKCLESIVNFETFFELLQSALRNTLLHVYSFNETKTSQN